MSARAPILESKFHGEPSVFRPEHLLREARRQKNLPAVSVPPVCVLDPDGDLLAALLADGRAAACPGWACYHTKLYRFTLEGMSFGIIGHAVGAAFSVLLAEQIFAQGGRLLISLTSAGKISEAGRAPYFVLIERALRDEGTSYHYLPPARYADADMALLRPVAAALAAGGIAFERGASWTTDAPYRETEAAIQAARAENILAVEMEAASLYAFARARGRAVLCFAQVTNEMGRGEAEFEKGEANGAYAALRLLALAARAALAAL